MFEIKIQAESAAELLAKLAALAAEVQPQEKHVCACAEKKALTKPVQEPAPKGTPAPELPWGKDNPVTMEEVRKVGGEYVKTGKRDDLKAILDAFGIAKIPECPADRLGELMEVLKNGLAE